MKKARSLPAQIVHTLGSMLSGQGLMIVAGIVISRVYGPSGKGMISYAGTAIMIAIAIADGLGSSIARRCGENAEESPASYASALRIVLMVSACALVPLVLIGAYVPSQHALLFVAVAFPFALYLQTMNGFYLIAHRIERTNLATLVTNAGSGFITLIVVLVFRPPIEVVLTIWAVGYIGGALVVFTGLGGIHQKRAAATAIRAAFSAHVRFAARSSLASVMTFLAMRIDVFIVSATLPAAALGNYTLALAVGELMWQISRAISWPAFGRVASESFASAADMTARITRIVIALEAVAAVVVFIAGPAALSFVYGSAFHDAGPALRVLVPGMAVYGADAILTYFLSVKAGKPGVIVRIEAVTLTLCAAGTLATVGRLGITGPAIATALAYGASFICKSILFVRVTGLPMRDLFLVRRSDFGANGIFARSQSPSRQDVDPGANHGGPLDLSIDIEKTLA